MIHQLYGMHVYYKLSSGRSICLVGSVFTVFVQNIFSETMNFYVWLQNVADTAWTGSNEQKILNIEEYKHKPIFMGSLPLFNCQTLYVLCMDTAVC
jgi:hypothetical protein